MLSLTDACVRKIYVDHIFDLYKNFDKLPSENPKDSPEKRRERKIKIAVRAVCTAVNLPPPGIIWIRSGTYFDYKPWSMELDHAVIDIDPRRNDGDPTRLPEIVNAEWFDSAIAPYHELRHAQQFFGMAQAMLTGAVAIPGGVGWGENLPYDCPIADRIRALSAYYGYRRHIVTYADRAKAEFPQHMIPLVRSWVESIFGKRNCERKHVLKHSGRCGHGYTAYRNLPEEIDAFRVEAVVERDLREAIMKEAERQGLVRPVQPPPPRIQSRSEQVNDARAELGFRGMRSLFHKGPR